MKTARILLLGLTLGLMTGCAAFETTPADVHEKLTHPLSGHLYEPDSASNCELAGPTGG